MDGIVIAPGLLDVARLALWLREHGWLYSDAVNSTTSLWEHRDHKHCYVYVVGRMGRWKAFYNNDLTASTSSTVEGVGEAELARRLPRLLEFAQSRRV